VERIAELDDDLTVKFLEGEEITKEELKAAAPGNSGWSSEPCFLRQLPCAIRAFSLC
jgi:hypothetical protein